MSEADSIKANIAFHEKMFFAAIAILVALVGWMASNYTNVSSSKPPGGTKTMRKQS